MQVNIKFILNWWNDVRSFVFLFQWNSERSTGFSVLYLAIIFICCTIYPREFYLVSSRLNINPLSIVEIIWKRYFLLKSIHLLKILRKVSDQNKGLSSVFGKIYIKRKNNQYYSMGRRITVLEFEMRLMYKFFYNLTKTESNNPLSL